MDFPLFPIDIFSNGEKSFLFFRKTFSEHSGKLPLDLEVLLYMLRPNKEVTDWGECV